MDTRREIDRLADDYRRQGFEVTLNPGPADLPDFAKDFRVEILAKRADVKALISAKDRAGVKSERDLPRYAEITARQPGWRFDLAVVEPEDPAILEIGDAPDYSEDDVDRVFAQAEEMARQGFVGGAVVSAWGAFESAMRRKSRAEGRKLGRDSSPRSMLHELYSDGFINPEELPKLETLLRVRNQVANGFLADLASEGDAVAFLREVGRRLVEGSRVAAHPA